MPPIFEYRHTVRENETDVLGRANNVAYVAWLQEAATAHSAAQGWPTEAYLRQGSGWVVSAHRIEYRRPAFPGDRIVVRTWVATMENVTSLRRYRIIRPADDMLLATAETRWAYIDFTTGRPLRIPPEVAGAFTVVEE